MNELRTAEAVSPAHPDKICDRISDAILDRCLSIDPNARCAIETMGGHGKIFVMGEITITNGMQLAFSEIEKITQKIGGSDKRIFINIERQSEDIARGVDTGGAGDQGIVVGHACKDNPAMIPQEHFLARDLCRFLYAWGASDGKTQVTIDSDNKIRTIVASWSGVSSSALKMNVVCWIEGMQKQKAGDIEILCNPAGDWERGGFESDTGLTGRKIVCDAYGPRVPVGGGAFSGKDPTKVDRSGAYRARQLAVEALCWEKHSNEIIIRAAYVIGEAKPIQIEAEVRGEGLRYSMNVTKEYEESFTPAVMIESLDLRKPQFEKTAEWGAFGNGFIWDKVKNSY